MSSKDDSLYWVSNFLLRTYFQRYLVSVGAVVGCVDSNCFKFIASTTHERTCVCGFDVSEHSLHETLFAQETHTLKPVSPAGKVTNVIPASSTTTSASSPLKLPDPKPAEKQPAKKVDLGPVYAPFSADFIPPHVAPLLEPLDFVARFFIERDVSLHKISWDAITPKTIVEYIAKSAPFRVAPKENHVWQFSGVVVPHPDTPYMQLDAPMLVGDDRMHCDKKLRSFSNFS